MKYKTKKMKMLPVIAILFAMLCAFVGVSILSPKQALAETILPPEYLKIESSLGNRTFQDGSTVFLAQNENLNITLGKPITTNEELVFENQSDIGNYALSFMEQSFSLKINNVEQGLGTLKGGDNPFLKFVPYQLVGNNSMFMYFDLTIDLGAINGESTHFFPTGEYVFTFNDYVEYSGTDFGVTKYCSFTITLYIFNTTDYFTTDFATNQNVEFLNVEHSMPSTVSHRNYYFFNYSNLNIYGASPTQNLLPQLKFDSQKFIVNISKSVSGTTYSCEISKFNNSLITLSQTTTTNFLTAFYDESTREITVNFQDIGEYVIDYKFVYEDYKHNAIKLESEEILTHYEKNDLLTIFGYQMYYAGQVDTQTEFRAYNDDKSATLPSKSADISYIFTSTEKSLIKTDDISSIDDTKVLEKINANNILPVSTNQPTVILNTNSKLDTASSCYYFFEDNIVPTVLPENATSFKNQSFSQSGTYLLRIVYTQPTYFALNGQLSDNTLFVQYFFFKISKTTPSVTIVENIENGGKLLNSNSYTKNEAKVTLQGQSIFNSTTTMQVYKKTFSANSTYVPYLTSPIIAQENSTSITLGDEGHYCIELTSGKNYSKITYFTIDKTAIDGINIIPVEKDAANRYTKDQNKNHFVNFFTSENVVVEWNEKASGAQTFGYYKYIPFAPNTNAVTPAESNKIYNSIDVKGIVTTDSLSLNADVYNKSSYTNNLNQINPSQVFSNQGLYIFQVYDQAGNETFFAFCIDKTDIQIMQRDDEMNYDTVKGFNLVTRESTTIEWGDYKLIDLNLNENDVENITDPWIKKTLKENIENAKICSINQDLYFMVKISAIYGLRTGTNLQLLSSNDNPSAIKGSSVIKLIMETDGYTFANEMSYSYYFIDESNKYYSEIPTLSKEEFVEHSDKDYSITTSSDASNANIFVNNASSLNEFDLNENSSALSQAGFADSFSNDEIVNPDIRTKYYFATGTTEKSKVSMLAYKIKLEISESLYVSKITMHYYPFVVNDAHNKTLSSEYVTTILYDVSAINQTAPTKLTGEGNEGFYGFNLNVGNYQSVTQYQTLPGKYVIVREYNSLNYENYDFKIRESVFIVDREEIVSSPDEKVDDKLISAVGNGIYISVLDGNKEAKQFKNIYSAKNNAQTYILQTNKLPVVVYVPVVKFGHQTTLTSFTGDKTLSYYLDLNKNGQLVRLKNVEESKEVASKLKLINFGIVIQEAFDKNLSQYKSTDYDLTVKITSANGTKIIPLTENNLGYWKSTAITQSGTYDIEIVQNNLNGKKYPNVFNTFKFSFQILELPPDFMFTDPQDTQNAGTVNTDANGVYYTNLDGQIKVVWTDPADTTYFSKINYQEENGVTKISYYYTTPQDNTKRNETHIKRSAIESQGKTHWFYIDISGVQSNFILNVYMEYERGIIPSDLDSKDFQRLTTVTKQLYIDRFAPTEVLDTLSANTTINGFTLASNTRKNVTLNGNGEMVDVSKSTVNPYKYNITQTSGAYANYAFAVKNGIDNEFVSMLHKTTTGYATNGYYSYISPVPDITQYTTKDISTAISLAKTSQFGTNQTLQANNYYEVIEVDLAGNVAIYLIYVIDAGFEGTVLSFDREKTDIEQKNQLAFKNITETQDIFAKSFLNILGINLYDYAFMEFSLDGQVYFKSSALLSNQCYAVSSITTQTVVPNTINIQNLLTFTAPSHHTLVINDSVNGKNYTFELYVDNKDLSFNLLQVGEGIVIKSVSNANIKHYLSSIKISSYDQNLDKYVVIYNKENPNFGSTQEISASVVQNQTYTFSVVAPNLAYTYEFVDNYGKYYVEHHTAGSFVLSEDQKIKNYFDKITIYNTVENKQTSDDWFVGNENIIFNFSSADYNAYLKIYSLAKNGKTFGWQIVNNTVESPYGTPISSQAGFITINDITYASISASPIHSTVKQLTLYAPTQNIFENNFLGGVYRYEITLVNHYDQSPDKVKETKILINNLTPIVDLKNKNNQSITSADALYTDQISIIVPSLREVEGLYSNLDVAKFLFNLQQDLTFNNETKALSSGTIVTQPGQYKVSIYANINENNYLISTKTFIIADSPTAFYQVWVRDNLTGELILAKTTGKEYVDKITNTICYHHYIVNSDPQIFLNESQSMHKTVLDVITNENITTTIYKLSNLEYVDSYNITPYETKIAITKIEKTDSILTNFAYSLNNGDSNILGGTGTNIIVTQNDQNADLVTIKFKSYYGIPENVITATYTLGNKIYFVNTENSKTSNSTTEFTLSNSGEYYLTFTDVAGNKQVFKDNNNIEHSYSYRILYVKGVPYLINGNTPIQNAIYNDKVEITVPAYLNNIYSSGGKPSIVIYKNNEQITNIKAENGVYTIKDDGYYQVYFTALVNGLELRKESYNFQILSSNAYVSSFSFSEYSNYEISSIIKNGEDITAKIKRLYGLNPTDKLTSMTLSLFDEKTGQGNYKATILTNSGFFTTQDNITTPEQFTFTFVIKSPITVPISVSINEGTLTKDPIKIEFNALDLYNDVGECTIVYGSKTLKVNQEYLNTLNNNYFCTLHITERGTHYVQVYSSSNNLLFSYRVDKKDPLNAFAIIIIVAGVAVAVVLTVSIVLLRKRMKIK